MTKKEDNIVIERKVRMSDSMLWSHQESYFTDNGIEAWCNKTPYIITSNNRAGFYYAKMIFAFIQDGIQNGSIDLEQPIYILELGTGHGRFSFHFLTYFNRLLKQLNYSDLKFTYIATDISDKNIDYWKKHKKFQPFIQSEQLDFAYYKIGMKDSIHLINKNITLDNKTIKNPLVAIANYLFCDTASDFFRIDSNHLYEGLVTLKTPKGNINGKRLHDLKKLNILIDYQPCSLSYYDEPIYNNILKSYEKEKKPLTFSLSTSLLTTVSQLKKLSNNKLLFLISDKGITDTNMMTDIKTPSLAIHERDFSTLVNFDALKRYTKLEEDFYSASEYNEGYKLVIFESYQNINNHHSFLQILNEYTLHHSNLFYCDLMRFEEEQTHAIKNHKVYLNKILALLKMSFYDTDMVRILKPQIFELINIFKNNNKMRDLKESHLAKTLMATIDDYYVLPENINYCYLLSCMLSDMEEYDLAIECLIEQEHYTPANINSLYNLGVCYMNLKKFDKAKYFIDQVIAQDENYGEAQKISAILNDNPS